MSDLIVLLPVEFVVNAENSQKCEQEKRNHFAKQGDSIHEHTIVLKRIVLTHTHTCTHISK